MSVNVKLVVLLVIGAWYAVAAYHVYARHIDRPNNPRPDARLAALAWLVSPVALVVASMACLQLALAEVRLMATPPTTPPAPVAGPDDRTLVGKTTRGDA